MDTITENNGNQTASAGAGSPADSQTVSTSSPAGESNRASSFESSLDSFFSEAQPAMTASPDPLANGTDASAQMLESGASQPPVVEEELPSPTDPRGQKLWEDLRSLREHTRSTLEPKAKGFDSWVEKVKDYGGEQVVEPALEVFTGFLSQHQRTDQFGNPLVDEQGNPVVVNSTLPGLHKLRELSAPLHDQLLNDVATAPEYQAAILNRISTESLLQELGLNPALYETYRQVAPDGTLNGQQAATTFDQAVFDELHTKNPELAKVYQGLTPEEREEVNLAQPFMRERALKAFLAEQREETRLKAEAAAREQAALEAKEAEKSQRINSFIESEQKAFFDGLAQAWQPFGQESESNQELYDFVRFKTVNAIQKSPEGQRLFSAIEQAVEQGDYLGLQTKLQPQLRVALTDARNKLVEQYSRLLSLPAMKTAQAVDASRQQTRTITASSAAVSEQPRQKEDLSKLSSDEVMSRLLDRMGLQ